MPSISFEVAGNELILCYSPAMGSEDILKRITDDKDFSIKHTFSVNKASMRKSDEYDFEETIRFCIGTVGDSYTQIDSEVIGTDHQFFFSNDIKLKPEMFIAYRNISILRKIDCLIERDFYVGGDWEAHNGISSEAFDELIKTFPKTAELDNYTHQRIAIILKEYFEECDKYEAIYKKYIESRKTPNNSEKKTESHYNLRIELDQFSTAFQELSKMLCHASAIEEKRWQEEIHNILQLMYPKYIFCAREVRFQGIGKHDKQPDFLLVDANGLVDILEIKKADVLLLTKYRNNYVASRELSGAIQQIEKYIYCLNSSDKAKEDVSKKLSPNLPAGVNTVIVNPQGILLLGRSIDFNAQQKRDFELIKRQYKHIADIMTYDELITRFGNIIASLRSRIDQY